MCMCVVCVVCVHYVFRCRLWVFMFFWLFMLSFISRPREKAEQPVRGRSNFSSNFECQLPNNTSILYYETWEQFENISGKNWGNQTRATTDMTWNHFLPNWHPNWSAALCELASNMCEAFFYLWMRCWGWNGHIHIYGSTLHLLNSNSYLLLFLIALNT